jgi:lipoyl-dependent peroxiredoxin
MARTPGQASRDPSDLRVVRFLPALRQQLRHPPVALLATGAIWTAEAYNMGSKANAEWRGGLKDGTGTMKPAHVPEIGFSRASRFEGQPSSNPEELIGAAMAGCFSMALTAALEKAGLKPQAVRTSADVQLEKQGEGFTITTIALTTEAAVQGIDAARFQSLADEVKKTCPVGKALAGTTITLEARLGAL